MPDSLKKNSRRFVDADMSPDRFPMITSKTARTNKSIEIFPNKMANSDLRLSSISQST